MEKKSKAAGVFKALFILLLIVTILSSAVYTIVEMSVQKGKREDVPPELFGHQYIPLTKDGMFESIPSGSIVLFEPAYVDDITPGSVILYYTPSVSTSNEVYEDFSMSTVQQVEQAEDGTVSFYVKSGDTNEVETISSNLLIAKGNYKLDNLAAAFWFINSVSGLICMVAIPFVLTVLFLVLFLAIRPKRVYDDDDDDEYEYYDEEDEEEDDEEEAQQARQMISQPKIKSQTVSTGATGEIAKSSPTMETVLSDKDRKDFEDDDKDYTSAFLDEDEDYGASAPSPTVSELSTLAASKLAVKTEPEEETEDDVDHTMEFDLAELQEELHNQALDSGEGMDLLADLDQQLAEIKEPEDSVLFILRDQSIDVNFRNIISADIEIKNHDDGSGFTIVTPNYNASITIDITNK